MGNHNSRPHDHTSPSISDGFTDYEAACKEDEDVKSFDSKIANETKKAMSAMASCVDNTVTLDSLKEVTMAISNVDLEAMQVLLAHQEHLSSPHFPDHDLLKDFYAISLRTIAFCIEVVSCTSKAKDLQAMVQMMLKDVPTDRELNEFQKKNIKRSLALFKKAGNPFVESFVEKFTSVYDMHVQFLEKLKERNAALDRKVKKVRLWAKVSSVLFGAAVAGVLICTVVAAAIAAPPVAAALLAVCSFPLGYMGERFRLMWKRFEEKSVRHQDMVKAMEKRTHVAVRELDNIKVHVDSFEVAFRAMVETIEFHDQAFIDIESVVWRMRGEIDAFGRRIEDLQIHAERAKHKLLTARTLVSQTWLG